MIQYLYTIAILAGINVILASGFNLILGYGGLVSVAHPVFYAIGGYASALLAQRLGIPIPLAILLATGDRGCDLHRAFASIAAGLGRLSGHRDHGIPARPRPHHQQCRVHRRRQRAHQHSVDCRGALSQRNLRRRRVGLGPGNDRADAMACRAATTVARSQPCATTRTPSRRSVATRSASRSRYSPSDRASPASRAASMRISSCISRRSSSASLPPPRSSRWWWSAAPRPCAARCWARCCSPSCRRRSASSTCRSPSWRRCRASSSRCW